MSIGDAAVMTGNVRRPHSRFVGSVEKRKADERVWPKIVMPEFVRATTFEPGDRDFALRNGNFFFAP